MANSLNLKDYSGDTITVDASGGDLDITIIEGDRAPSMVCLSRSQAKELRKHIKKLVAEGKVSA